MLMVYGFAVQCGHATCRKEKSSTRLTALSLKMYFSTHRYLATAKTARHAQPIKKSRPPIGVIAPNIPTPVSASA